MRYVLWLHKKEIIVCWFVVMSMSFQYRCNGCGHGLFDHDADTDKCVICGCLRYSEPSGRQAKLCHCSECIAERKKKFQKVGIT